MRVRVMTPKDSEAFPFAVIARSTSRSGPRRNSPEERLDSAMISSRTLRVAPASACVGGRDSLPMQAWYCENEKADVSWSASGGSIDANGMFRAPGGGSGSITVIARDRRNPQIEARAEVFLGCLDPVSMSGTLIANAGSPAAVGFMGWEPDDSEEEIVEGPFAQAAAAMRMMRGVAKQDEVEDLEIGALRTLQISAATTMTGLVTGASIPVASSGRVIPSAYRQVFHLDALFDIGVDLEEQRKKDFTIRESGMKARVSR